MTNWVPTSSDLITAHDSTALVEPLDALLERLDQLLQEDMNPEQEQLSAPPKLLKQLRAALIEREQTIASMSERSGALARAQADAIVHSAEIIDELEQTKKRLSDARIAAEQAAADTRRLADTVFERTNDGVLVFCGGACIACNDNALTLLGSSRSAILGVWPKSFEEAKYETGDSAGKDLRSIYSTLSPTAPSVVEVQLPGSESSTFWAEITMSGFAMNRAAHVLVVVRDISSRKLFEKELQRHRDFLDNIINAVPDQLSVTSADRKLVLANDAYCNTLGVEREAVIGRYSYDLHESNSHDRIRELEDQVITTGSCITAEQEVLQLDGSRRILSVKRSTLSGDAHRGYIVATARDITEDRLREDRLRLLASVFNGASEGVAILSPDGRICEANPAFLKMATQAQQLPVGTNLTDTMKFEIGDIGRVLNDVARGLSWAGKAHFAQGGPKQRHFWVSLSPSSEANGKTHRVIALVSDITELQRAQEQLRSQALYDSLTGLPNRPHFRDHLLSLIDSCDGLASQFTVCFLDLDDFKHVNDSAGHAAGDALLCAVAKRIQRVMGEETFVARFGGDEFAMILTADQYQPLQSNAKLEELLEEFRHPFQLDDTEAVVGLSIGLTQYPDHGREVGALMCNADIAMYAAKTAGKNRIRTFSPELEDGVNTRHQVQSLLRRALKGGDIRLCYQPKIHAKTGAPVGCEALARWQTADGSFIPPSEFVPIAEQSGLIVPLGDLVFRLAATQACLWHHAGKSPLIAVNVSPHQLRYSGFQEQLKEVLAETGAQAEWFELEVTESAMMENVEQAMRTIENLTEMGFRIAIDDFGTGYSSLSYLKHFRIHTLKIDLSFVRDVTHDWQSSAVVRSIVSLGSGLGLDIVAEGVETAAQAQLLAEFGCTTLQGFHFAQPMTAEEYERWLLKHASTTVTNCASAAESVACWMPQI